MGSCGNPHLPIHCSSLSNLFEYAHLKCFVGEGHRSGQTMLGCLSVVSVFYFCKLFCFRVWYLRGGTPELWRGQKEPWGNKLGHVKRQSAVPLYPYRFIWEKDGMALNVENVPRMRLDNMGTLHIAQTWSGDIGTYTCRVVSAGGNDSRSAHLRVR